MTIDIEQRIQRLIADIKGSTANGAADFRVHVIEAHRAGRVVQSLEAALHWLTTDEDWPEEEQRA